MFPSSPGSRQTTALNQASSEAGGAPHPPRHLEWNPAGQHPDPDLRPAVDPGDEGDYLPVLETAKETPSARRNLSTVGTSRAAGPGCNVELSVPRSDSSSSRRAPPMSRSRRFELLLQAFRAKTRRMLNFGHRKSFPIGAHARESLRFVSIIVSPAKATCPVNVSS